MTEVSFSLTLEILVALLLVIMIGYAFVLNKRLGLLRRDKAELEKLALNFHAATERAEDSISRLKDGIESLQARVEKGESLRDDLIFLSERGGSVADRLEAAARSARDDIGVGPVANNPAPQPAGAEKAAAPGENAGRPEPNTDSQDRPDSKPAAAREKPVSEAEKELLKALRSVG